MNNQIVLETLKLMLKYKDNPDFTSGGLCSWVIIMTHEGLLTETHRIKTREYIHQNRPKSFSWFERIFCGGSPNNYYYWRPGCVAPRVRWIKKHINLLSKSIH